MANEQEIEAKFWKALRSDMTLMLGLVGSDDGHAQPMTAQFDGDHDRGPIWFFTSKETDLARNIGTGGGAVANFASKGHDLFASVHGRLSADNDRAVIDRLWNRYVAAWFEGGKDDPKLQLLRFDPERAQVWIDASSLIAGVKLMLGVDPKESYKDKVAEISLG